MANRTLISMAMLAAVALPGSARGQGVERVRALYVAAAYEEALAAIPPAPAPAVKLEVEQYRALCLLALGREAEASSVVEGVVRDHPTFVPSARDVSPRMLAIFSAARVKLLPDLARQAYAEGKSAFDANDDVAADAAFRRALAIVDGLPEKDRGTLADLRLLAAEFLDLSAARSAPANAPEKVANVPPLPEAYYGPEPVDEALPPWNPPDAASMRSQYLGVLRVEIGADGRVSSAEIVKSSHPSYDALVARTAKNWRYRPATRGGKPVASRKDVQIRLVPR